MALIIDGKVFRNLEEQVRKNKEDIARHYAIDRSLANFGIKIVGTVATEPEIYFTTSQNVISLDSAGKSITAYVSAVNLSSSEYSNIMWESDNEDVATVI